MAKSINKTTLADKYGWSLWFLRKKINQSTALLRELIEITEYNPYDRVFTPKQVDIIYKHFGKPSDED